MLDSGLFRVWFMLDSGLFRVWFMLDSGLVAASREVTEPRVPIG
jgi:hypothetical protein